MERVMEDVVKVVVAKVGPAAKMRPRMLVRMAHPEERVEGGLILDPESITAFVMKERNLPKRQRGESVGRRFTCVTLITGANDPFVSLRYLSI